MNAAPMVMHCAWHQRRAFAASDVVFGVGQWVCAHPDGCGEPTYVDSDDAYTVVCYTHGRRVERRFEPAPLACPFPFLHRAQDHALTYGTTVEACAAAGCVPCTARLRYTA